VGGSWVSRADTTAEVGPCRSQGAKRSSLLLGCAFVCKRLTSIVLVRTRACDSAVEEECVSVCVCGDGMRRPAAVQAPTHPPSLHLPPQHLSQYHTVNITGSVCVLRVFVQLAWEGSKHVCAKRNVPFCCHGQAPHCPFLPPLCSTAAPTVHRKRLRRYPKG